MYTAENKATCVIQVNTTLLPLGYLAIQGELQHMLTPFAGKKLSIDIGDGNPLKCRLNVAGNRIRSRKLADYIINAGTPNFTVIVKDDGTLFLRPQEHTETSSGLKKPSSRKQQGTSSQNQTDEIAGIKTEEVLNSLSSPAPIDVTKATLSRPKRHRQTYAQPNLFGNSESDSFKDLLVKQPHKSASTKTVAKKKDPLELQKLNEERKRRKEEKRKAEEELLKQVKLINDELAENNKRGKKQEPDSRVSDAARIRDKTPLVVYQKTQIKSPELTDEQVTAVKLPQLVAKAREAPPVRISFSPEKDAVVLKLAETGTISPAADFYLHRQALSLLLSPGFDTLLSINAVHNIQSLEYQLATVRHVLKNLRGRALLCDEVGLGKTIEAGLIMMEYILRGLARRVLILTPPSLVEQWHLEMQTRFNLDFITYDAPEFKSTPRPWSNFPRIIASIDTAKREPHRDMVLEPTYDLVIVDEAHHLKKQRTQAYQLVSQLKKKYILLLTATPVENNLEELFNLTTLLQPGQLETVSTFKKKFITRGDPLKPKNTEELKKLVREIMVRNRRSETGVITAGRYAEIVEVILSPAEDAFYRRLTSFIRGYYTPGSTGTAGGVNQFVLKTLQREVGSSIEAVLPTLGKIANGENHPVPLKRLAGALIGQAESITHRAKAEALVRLLQKIPEKAIVFTCFRETQRFLAEFLRREGLSVAELHGGMRRAEKEEQVRAFTGDARILVSTETGSEGRNLQFCHIIVNYDLPWNPMRIEQRIGRIHRLGQKRDVYIYNLSAADTIEAHILDLLDAKINMFQLVVGELDMILGNIQDKRDFEDMIMDIWAGTEDETKLKAGLDELGNRLVAAKEHYLAIKELDDELLGELRPED